MPTKLTLSDWIWLTKWFFSLAVSLFLYLLFFTVIYCYYLFIYCNIISQRVLNVWYALSLLILHLWTNLSKSFYILILMTAWYFAVVIHTCELWVATARRSFTDYGILCICIRIIVQNHIRILSVSAKIADIGKHLWRYTKSSSGKRSTATVMLLDLGLPCFCALLHNARFRLSIRLNCSVNSLVRNVNIVSSCELFISCIICDLIILLYMCVIYWWSFSTVSVGLPLRYTPVLSELHRLLVRLPRATFMFNQDIS